MKCTKCSKTVKPVVAVDIDGTLGDYHGHFHKFAELYMGYELPSAYDGSMEFSEYLGLDKRTYRDIKLSYRQGAQKRSMPIYPGAVRFMHDLVTAGCEVWITTTRPYMRLDNVDPDTRFWLNNHTMPYDGMVYDDDKYEQLVGMLDPNRVILVVEDLLEQCSRAGGMGLSVVQPLRSHNVGAQWPVVFERFDTVSKIVMRSLKEWNIANA